MGYFFKILKNGIHKDQLIKIIIYGSIISAIDLIKLFYKKESYSSKLYVNRPINRIGRGLSTKDKVPIRKVISVDL